jgi:UDP-N-acetylmuramyl tripeptide synthase
LPKDFQRSEFLLDHGMVDDIVDRRELRNSDHQAAELHDESPISMASRTSSALGDAPLREVDLGLVLMRFDEAVQYLLSLGHETLTIKLGLRNTELLLQILDNPERTFRAVQIAGTNGKGSTAVMLDSICRAAGIKTGLYTSPHLVSITERIESTASKSAKKISLVTRPTFAMLLKVYLIPAR